MVELRVTLSETMDKALGVLSKKVGIKKPEYVRTLISEDIKKNAE